MKTIKAMIWLLVITLGLSISILSVPQTVSAQTEKDKCANKQETDDEEEDGDEVSAEEAKSAVVTLDDARAIALEKIPGTVVEEELEKEHGRLQYAFDIRDENGKLFEVEIDAVTGEILQATEVDEDDVKTSKKVVKKTKVLERTVKVVKTKPQ